MTRERTSPDPGPETVGRAGPVGFPPEPWRLVGHLHLAVWLVPAARLPAVAVPGTRPLVLARRGVVGTAWVVYGPGGVLAYDELMVTVLVRRGRRLLPSITSIWVDSPVSRDGGRALWGIPKELARFRVREVDGGLDLSAEDDDGALGAVALRRGRRLLVRVPFRFRVLQERDGRALRSPVRGRARLALERGTWTLPDHGPLAVLRGRRPVLQLALHDFVVRFGHPEGASGPPSVMCSAPRGRGGAAADPTAAPDTKRP